jgi:hypothetical protein
MSTIRIGLLVVTLVFFYTPALAKSDKVTICHKAGSENQVTLTISQQALDKHLVEHGDTLGACGAAATSSVGCPCFDDLSQVGFTDQASCTNVGGNVDITDFSSSFLFAQASESICGLDIIGTGNDISIEDLNPKPKSGRGDSLC